MKKLLTILLTLSLFVVSAFSLTACAGGVKGEEVTAEQWATAITSMNNYSMEYTLTGEEDGVAASMSMSANVTENAFKRVATETIGDESETMEQYYSIETVEDVATIYAYAKVNDVWAKTPVPYPAEYWTSLTGSTNVLLSYVIEDKFEEFTYDSGKGAYTCATLVFNEGTAYEQTLSNIDIRIKDGKVVYCKMDANTGSGSGTLQYKDFGTTTVTLPTIAE